MLLALNTGPSAVTYRLHDPRVKVAMPAFADAAGTRAPAVDIAPGKAEAGKVPASQHEVAAEAVVSIPAHSIQTLRWNVYTRI